MADLVTKLTLDNQTFLGGLTKAETEAKSFAQKLGETTRLFGVGGFVGALIGGFAGGGFGGIIEKLGEKFAEFANAFQDQVKETKRLISQTGFSPEIISQFTNLADAGGTSVDAFTRALQKMADEQQKVIRGGPGSAEALRNFQSLGATLAQIQTMEAQDLFVLLFDRLKGMSLSGEKLAALKDIFGRGSLELLPAARIGRDSPAAEGGGPTAEDLENVAAFKRMMAESGVLGRELGHELERIVFWMKQMFNPVNAATVAFLQLEAVIKRLRDRNQDSPFVNKLFDIISTLANPALSRIFDQEPETPMTEEQKKRFEAQKARREQMDADKRAQEEENDREAFRLQAEEDKADKINEQTAKKMEQNRLAGMSPSERLAELITSLRNLDEKMRGPKTPLEAAELQAKRVDLEEQIRKAGEGIKPEKAVFDSLATIGGLSQFGAFNEQLEIDREILKANQDAAAYLRELLAQGF